MTLEDFKYRYFIILKSEFRNQKTKCVELFGEELYNDYIDLMNSKGYQIHDSYLIIVDIIDREVIMLCDTNSKSFLLDMEHNNLNKFKDFKTSINLAYNQNIIRMSSIEGRIDSVYAVSGVWCLITYITNSNKNRVLVNKNAFGRFSLLDTRDYKIHKLLSD